MPKLSRSSSCSPSAPLVAAPVLGKLALDGDAAAAGHDHSRHLSPTARPRRAGPRGDDRRGRRPRSAARTISTRSSTRRRRCRTSRAACASTSSPRIDREHRDRAGRLLPGLDVQRHRARPVIRATEGDLLRVNFVNGGSHPHTIHFHGIHPTNMDGVFEIVAPRRRVHLRVRGAAGRDAPLPLPRDAAEEAHPQGPLRRVHHRPGRAAAARAGARHGDERLRHGRRRRATTSTPSTAGASTTRATRSSAPLGARPRSTSRT